MRPIDADALTRRALKEKRFVFTTHDLLNNEYVVQTVYKDLAEFINEAPTIDAVPVVRCKDCKHSTTFHHTGNMYCGLHENHHFLTDAYGFCNKGERRCDNE